MNSREYMLNKKFRLSSSNTELANNSVQRITYNLNKKKELLYTINPDIFNSKLKYLYTIEKVDNIVYDRANQFPLLLITSSNCDLDAILNNYSIDRINYFLSFLKNDKYDEVLSKLSTEENQKILYGLYKLKISVGECFQNMISVYESIFLTIKYFYFLYGDYTSNKMQFDKYKKDSEILNDMQKLKEYINQMHLNLNQVTSISIKASKLQIKPEYLRYIQLYGVPYKTVFDEVLLQQIIDDMKREEQLKTISGMLI